MRELIDFLTTSPYDYVVISFFGLLVLLWTTWFDLRGNIWFAGISYVLMLLGAFVGAFGLWNLVHLHKGLAVIVLGIDMLMFLWVIIMTLWVKQTAKRIRKLRSDWAKQNKKGE